MPKRVRGRRFGDARSADGLFDGPLEDRLVEMVSSLFTSLGASPAVPLRNDPLPPPVRGGVGILPVESVRHLDPSPTVGQALLIYGLD